MQRPAHCPSSRRREALNFLAKALGSKTPKGLKFQIPSMYVQNGKSVLELGRTLETAFIAAYLGAVKTFSSTDLKVVAAQVAANEASHYSFFDAALGGTRSRRRCRRPPPSQPPSRS